MGGFYSFIRTQVSLAQAILACLFLLYEEEVREEVVLALVLGKLQDNLTNNQRGTPATAAVPASRGSNTHGSQWWLLDRVLQLDWLREEFLEVKIVRQDC
ncbi:uncharacterized protein BDV17DRAFT_295608 [Aspergillus undulatus]|uniref:uncharacterized protein n=1 Tax=Aspergillus undulatus TaxID=1810928 RepID=UPI003CCE3B24